MAVDPVVKAVVAEIVEKAVKKAENAQNQRVEAVARPPMQACFAPRRRPPVAVAVERSPHFIVTSEPSGNLPIGKWAVRRCNEGEAGSDWNSLPYPAELKKEVKRLEELMEEGPLTEAQTQERAALEQKYTL